MSELTNQSISAEKKQIVLLSVAGIFLSLIITSLILGIPYYNHIKSNAINSLQLITNNKALTLSHQLYRYRNQARSISQRIHATRLLGKYYREEISMDKFRIESSRILNEAISQTEDIIGLIRLSNTHQPLLELGRTIPDTDWQPYITSFLADNSPHMIAINGNNILLLMTSITNHVGKVIGADITAFDTTRLSLITQPYEHDSLPVNCTIFTAHNDKIHFIIPYLPPNATPHKDKELVAIKFLHDTGKNLDQITGIDQQVVTYEQVNDSPWIVAISTSKKQLYKELKEKLIFVGAELFIISIIAALLMLRIMKPLSHKIVRHSEQLLHETEERFRTLVETTNDWIWEIDESGKYTYSSPSIESILGYTNEEIIGHTLFDYMPEDEARRISKVFHQLSSTHQPIHNLANINLHKDGHQVILETSGSPYFSANGEYKGYRGVDRDITSRKAIEEELTQYRDHLETLVNTRTSELIELNQELESFSYTVSHDLRTPLRGIDGFTAALQEEYSDQLDATGNDYLLRVRQATGKMAELIDALLQLTRITRHEINIEETSLSSLAKSSIQQHREIDKNRNVETVITPGIYCQCDKKLMQIVMDNLIGNAWKYTSKESNPKIEFGSLKQNGEITYFVKDNGTGFSDEYADKIFKPFQRLHTDREFNGTGIGLATVQRIIQKHGGKIWATSSLNHGSTFYFTLGKI